MILREYIVIVSEHLNKKYGLSEDGSYRDIIIYVQFSDLNGYAMEANGTSISVSCSTEYDSVKSTGNNTP